MTQKEIIEMARKAGFKMENSAAIQAAEAFAKLVAEKEREACAKVCDDIDAEYEGEDVLATWCSKAIRARVQA